MTVRPSLNGVFPTRLSTGLGLLVMGWGLATPVPGRAEVAGGAPPAARTQWFREAKFGLFIHWGLYAIPAGRWQGQPVSGIGEWIMNRGKVPVADYAALARQFNPTNFDAEAWAQLAQDAGMGYVVITSKHHDGFALFGSKVSPYNVVDATPFRRDILKELAAACARRGLKFGFYYSQSQDWHHPGGAVSGGAWDKAQEGDFDTYLRTIAEPQVRELLTGYGPLGLIWFDTPVNMTEERARPFVQAIRTLQPDCLINSRLLLRGADIRHLSAEEMAKAAALGCDYISRGDNEIPPQAVPGLWETPATLNDTWGFKTDDQNWKAPEALVFKLVDIVSKGGNYLLNVGPDARGVIPLPSQAALRAVGGWLKVNGEAIHGAGPTPFGQEYGRPAANPAPAASVKRGAGRRPAAPVMEGSLPWRCTVQPYDWKPGRAGKLYFHLTTLPGPEFALPPLPTAIARASLLADPARPSLEVKVSGERSRVMLPAVLPGDFARVLCVEVHGR